MPTVLSQVVLAWHAWEAGLESSDSHRAASSEGGPWVGPAGLPSSGSPAATVGRQGSRKRAG
eukprot:13423173-Alexandrium_andersonii.AAC.1